MWLGARAACSTGSCRSTSGFRTIEDQATKGGRGLSGRRTLASASTSTMRFVIVTSWNT